MFSYCSGNARITRFVDREPDHIVPSSSAHRGDTDLFLMAPLSGLSPVVVHAIVDGSAETAVVLSDSMLWPLLYQHPDVIPVIFPCEINDKYLFENA